MGADLDLAQRTVVLQIAVMNTLINGAFNCLVGIVVHAISLPYLWFSTSISDFSNNHAGYIIQKNTQALTPVCFSFTEKQKSYRRFPLQPKSHVQTAPIQFDGTYR